MKRLLSFFKEMTLTQQLFGIVFVFITFFLSFFYVYLNGNIDIFSHEQMKSVLESNQESDAYTYFNNNRDIYYILNRKNDNVANALIIEGKALQSHDFSLFPEAVKDEMFERARKQKVDTNVYLSSAQGSRLMYRVKHLDKQATMITILKSHYQSEFKSTLINTVVNVIVIVVALLFVLMLLWVTYLIHSLRQLQTYINKIRKNEPAKLRISSRSEIGQVAEALIAMDKEIKRQERIKEELIQNISHDLKTPIATIKSYGESIKDGIYPYKTLENSIDVIIEHADRLEKKVYNLLLLNRVGYLTTSKDVGVVNMKEIIEKTLLSIKVIRPEVHITPDLKDVEFVGNEEPWRVVIENILDNALRYAKSEINIVLKKDYLSIENDGSTLTSEWKEKMFKPYEKGSDGEFGLGLSIVYKVVDAYGYTIYGENTEVGVIFVIEPKKKGNHKNKNFKKKK